MSKSKAISNEVILDKALLVISDKGPETFTLADISKVVGLSPATLLQRFGSKQTLLIRAAKQANVKLNHDLAALKEKQLPWDQELIHFLCDIPEGFGSRRDIANSLGVLKLDMIDPELHPIARKLFETFRKRIGELIKKGQACNEISGSIDIQALVWELDALRHGLVIQWTLSGKGTLQKWMKHHFQQFLRRLKP
jgi:AcrR family transcriptional regulator